MDHQCKAHNRSGKRCEKGAVPGAAVCHMHGGGAPQVQKAARERIVELVDPALNELARLIAGADTDSVKLQAVKDVLDRAGYKPAQEVKGEIHNLLDLVNAAKDGLDDE